MRNGLKPMLIPVPFAAWHALAWFAEMLPSPPITRNQVELMQVDNVSSPEMLGFGELGISPDSVEEILQEILWDHRSKSFFGWSAPKWRRQRDANTEPRSPAGYHWGSADGRHRERTPL